jgi:hypothetical protein
MRAKLDTPNPALEQGQIDEINQNNIKQLTQTLNNTGVFILKDIKTNTTTSLAIAATATKIAAFDTVITSNGGMVDFDFYTTAEVGTGVSWSFYLYVDEKLVSSAGSANPNTAIAVFVALKHKAMLDSGSHRVNVSYSTNGAFPISYNSKDTRLLISETKL